MDAMDDTERSPLEMMACPSQANHRNSPREGERAEEGYDEGASLEMSNGVHSDAEEAPVDDDFEQNDSSSNQADGNHLYENGFSDASRDVEAPIEDLSRPGSPSTQNCGSPANLTAESRSFEESSSDSISNTTGSHSENPTSSPFRDSSSLINQPLSPGSESVHSKIENELLNESSAVSDSDLDTSFEKSSEDGDDVKGKLDESFTSEVGQNDISTEAELEISDNLEVEDTEASSDDKIVAADESEQNEICVAEKVSRESSPPTTYNGVPTSSEEIENTLPAEEYYSNAKSPELEQPQRTSSPPLEESVVKSCTAVGGTENEPEMEEDSVENATETMPENVCTEVGVPEEGELMDCEEADMIVDDADNRSNVDADFSKAVPKKDEADSEEVKGCIPEHRTEQFRLEDDEMISEPTEDLSIVDKADQVAEMISEPTEDLNIEDNSDFAAESEPTQNLNIVDNADPAAEMISEPTEDLSIEDNADQDADMISEPTGDSSIVVNADSDAEQRNDDLAVRHPDTPEPRQPVLVLDSADQSLPYHHQQPADEDDDDPSALTIDTGECSKEHSPKDHSNENQTFRYPSPSDDGDSDALTIDTSKFDKVAKKKSAPKNSHIKLIIRNDRKEKKFTIGKSKKGPKKLQAAPVAPPTPPSTTISSDLKCPRCPASSFSTVSTLLDHQRLCGSLSSTPMAPQGPRKVYLCSSCESYMENWELFHHMKELHHRHICLHCLVLFTHTSKLAHHMFNKHRNAINLTPKCGADFARDFPGPYSVLCASCGLTCSPNDFESHMCSTVCSHCGLEGTHYPTCRLAPPPTLNQKKRRVKGGQRAAKKQPKMRLKAAPPATPETQQLTLETSPSQSTELSGPQEFSPTTYHEKMMELYRSANFGRQQEKPLPNARFSTAESIEDSINRVLETVASPERNFASPERPRVESPVPANESPSPQLKVESSPAPEPPPTPPVAPVLPPQFYPKKRLFSEPESSDSDKLTIELNPRRKKMLKTIEPQNRIPEPHYEELQDAMVVAGEETPFTCVPLQEPLNRARVPTAMKLFLRATALTCVYCAHARKIAVNAKQLALHQLSQHRYITLPETTTVAEKNACHAAAVKVMKEAIPTLADAFFNAYGFDSTDKSAWRSADRAYECFHCNISTPDLREFNVHNRKLHSNEMRTKRRTETHLCIMCKTRFLTYTELLCHLCRGVYVPGQIIDPNSRYRCYCCDVDPLPSSFRLMVHLRLNHTTCDMCFAVCDSQHALQSHVMGHKAIHYCYACALTYDSRQELSKHIFWKHGAESAICKRCDRKKWKHAYHFCLPPPVFTCPECKLEVKSALALRVHSRIHEGVLPHSCTECSDKFISKKLLEKHTAKVHREYVPEEPPPAVNGGSPHHVPTLDDAKKKPKKDKKKDLRELFDLPPVNLSESDDSSDEEKPAVPLEEGEVADPKEEKEVAPSPKMDMKDALPAVEGAEPPPVPEPVVGWDGVLASLEGASKPSIYPPESPFFNLPAHRVIAIANADHDYCRPSEIRETIGNDHDYCNNSGNNRSHATPNKHNSPCKQAKRRNRSSSSDSSSSNSSSSSCGSKCSHCSSTSSTESASSGEMKPKESQKKKKLLTKAERKKTKAEKPKPQPTPEPQVDVREIRIQESDLETDEVITDDEEFYELNPALRASQVLLHNRSILLDKLDVSSPQSPYPVASTSSPLPSTKKKKSKKGRPMGSIGKIRVARPYTSSPYALSSPPPPHHTYEDPNDTDDHDGKRPRRKRVPQKYYGFTSEDEDDGSPHVRKRKRRIEVEHNTTIPASPPRPPPPEPEPEPSNLWNPPSWRAPPIAPKVNPIKIRTGSLKQTFAKSNNSDEFHIKRAELGGFHVNGAESSNGTKNEKLYCYCHCPYDEVSEMIACDAVDCRIEWFHFECVNIMDPPKGKWFCPECLKKKAAESEMMGIPFR